MAITYFNSASSVADNGTAAGPTVTVTPPASMQAGDLVVIAAQYRGSVTLTISNTGGQTWNSLAAIANTNITGRLFWCTFNGTWSGGDPSVTNTTGTLALTAVMHVFRPTSTSHNWAVDVAQVETDFAAPTTPFTVTINGVTTTHADTVTLATWMTADDNTWGSLSGSGWVVTGSAQYRNLSGQDQSSSYAHNIRTTAGTVANVSKNQATLGGDLGTTSIVSFYEFVSNTFTSTLTAQNTNFSGSTNETITKVLNITNTSFSSLVNENITKVINASKANNTGSINELITKLLTSSTSSLEVTYSALKFIVLALLSSLNQFSGGVSLSAVFNYLITASLSIFQTLKSRNVFKVLNSGISNFEVLKNKVTNKNLISIPDAFNAVITKIKTFLIFIESASNSFQGSVNTLCSKLLSSSKSTWSVVNNLTVGKVLNSGINTFSSILDLIKSITVNLDSSLNILSPVLECSKTFLLFLISSKNNFSAQLHKTTNKLFNFTTSLFDAVISFAEEHIVYFSASINNFSSTLTKLNSQLFVSICNLNPELLKNSNKQFNAENLFSASLNTLFLLVVFFTAQVSSLSAGLLKSTVISLTTVPGSFITSLNKTSQKIISALSLSFIASTTAQSLNNLTSAAVVIKVAAKNTLNKISSKLNLLKINRQDRIKKS